MKNKTPKVRVDLNPDNCFIMANSQQMLSSLHKKIAEFYETNAPDFKAGFMELVNLHIAVSNVYDVLNMTFTAAQNLPESIGVYGSQSRKYGEAQGTMSVWTSSRRWS